MLTDGENDPHGLESRRSGNVSRRERPRRKTDRESLSSSTYLVAAVHAAAPSAACLPRSLPPRSVFVPSQSSLPVSNSDQSGGVGGGSGGRRSSNCYPWACPHSQTAAFATSAFPPPTTSSSGTFPVILNFHHPGKCDVTRLVLLMLLLLSDLPSISHSFHRVSLIKSCSYEVTVS